MTFYLNYLLGKQFTENVKPYNVFSLKYKMKVWSAVVVISALRVKFCSFCPACQNRYICKQCRSRLDC